MLPEVETYVNSLRASDDYWVQRRKVERENPVPDWSLTLPKEERDAYYEAVAKRETAMRELDRAQKESQASALEGLRESDNPMVRWIASQGEIMEQYSSHAETILVALPMDREQIEEFGDKQDWCGVYTRFLRAADEAGVLPEPSPEIALMKPLLDEFVRWYGGNESLFRSMIKKHIPSILERARQVSAA